jgi:hypothetical protein
MSPQFINFLVRYSAIVVIKTHEKYVSYQTIKYITEMEPIKGCVAHAQRPGSHLVAVLYMARLAILEVSKLRLVTAPLGDGKQSFQNGVWVYLACQTFDC